MITTVYVDGFNLYYGAVRGTPYRWLDPLRLAGLLLPRHEITSIKYFTARVSPRPDDPEQPRRQETYLRALRTVPGLEIIFGHFLSAETMMRVAPGQTGLPRFVRVIRTEEKGSDGNLATHLLRDGYTRRYAAAALITNDSDLVEPVRVVRRELGKVVGILNPHPRPSVMLRQEASFVKPIRRGALAAAQLPARLRDGAGEVVKPAGW